MIASAAAANATSFPREPAFDSTRALLREGYRFIADRCRRYGTDAFECRLVLHRAVCAEELGQRRQAAEVAAATVRQGLEEANQVRVGLGLAAVDARWLIALGAGLLAVGCFWMSAINLDISPWQVVWPRVVQTLGLTCLFTPLNVAAYATIAPHLRPAAVGLFALLRNEGESVGTSLAGALRDRRKQFHAERLGEGLHPLNPAAARISRGFTT